MFSSLSGGQAINPTQPISVEPGALNSAIPHGDIIRVDKTGDEAKPVAIVLSEDQTKILEKVKKGGSVFVTGSAGTYSHVIYFVVLQLATRILGTGKTVLLREIIGFLRSTGCIVAVTASTGIASVNIGGTTLHSWAGIGLGEHTAKRLSRKILGTKSLRERWLDVDSLIIDESEISSLRLGLVLNKGLVSMVGGILFDKLVGLYKTFLHNDVDAF